MEPLITLNIYGDDDEIIKTYSQTNIPWSILKKAISVGDCLSQENASPLDFINEIETLVCEAFRNRIPQEELEQASIEDVINTFYQIANSAGIVKKNITPLKKPSKKAQK